MLRRKIFSILLSAILITMPLLSFADGSHKDSLATDEYITIIVSDENEIVEFYNSITLMNIILRRDILF